MNRGHKDLTACENLIVVEQIEKKIVLSKKTEMNNNAIFMTSSMFEMQIDVTLSQEIFVSNLKFK